MRSAFSFVLIFVVLALAGFALLPQVPLRLMPSRTLPRVTVRLTYPDAAPLNVEREVTARVEATLAELTEVDNIRSRSDYGRARVTLTLRPEADRTYKKFEIRARLRALLPDLPPSTDFSVTFATPDEESSPYVLAYTFVSDRPPGEMQRQLEPLLQRYLAFVPGLADAELTGAPTLALKMRLDPQKLARLGLTPDQLIDLLRTDEPVGGTVAGDPFVLRQPPQATLDALRKLPVTEIGGRRILLGQVAELALEPLTPQRYFRINGREPLTLRLRADPDVNLVSLADEIYLRMAALEAALPDDYQLRTIQDESIFLREELQKLLFRTLGALAMLLLCLLLFTRSLRYTAALLANLLVSLGLSFAVFFLLKIELHLYALAGLAVAFGMVVDNAILVLDSVRRQPLDRAFATAGNAFMPVLAATLTTLVSLLTVYFLPEKLRVNLFDFCLVVATCLASSLLVARYFAPALAVQMKLSGTTQPPQADAPAWLLRGARLMRRLRAWVIAVLILAFGLPVYLLPTRAEGEGVFAKTYNAVFDTETYQQQVRPWVERTLGGSSRLFYRYVWDRYSYNEPEQTRVVVRAELPNSYTPQQLNRLMQPFEALADSFAAALDRHELTVYNGQTALLELFFNETYGDGITPYRAKSQLQRLALARSGVGWDIYGVGRGFSTDIFENPRYSIQLRGYDYDRLDAFARGIADSLLRNVRVEEVDVNAQMGWRQKPREQLVFEWEAEALARYGLRPDQIAARLRLYGNQETPAATVWMGGVAYPLVVKMQGYESQQQYDLFRTPMAFDSLRLHLGSLGSVRRERAQNAVHKRDQQYLRRLQYTYLGSDKFGRKHARTTLDEWRRRMPPGLEGELEGFRWWNRDDTRYQLLMVVAIIGLIFVISAVLLESLVWPLLVIAIIPLSYIGVFLTFYLFDVPFDQGAFGSFLLLAGLTVNNSLFVIYRLRKLPTRDAAAVWDVFREKSLPIVLTVVSTCASLAPLLLDPDAPFWFSLAAGSIGGLVFSTGMLLGLWPLWVREKGNTR